MDLVCNIDYRGRALRLGLGTLLVILGVAAAADGRLLSAGLLLAGGGFSLFEGIQGWCAVKAVLPKFPV